MHLKPEDLVDIAEGTRAETSAPHLANCSSCRRLLDELRAVMTSMADEDARAVPEPSPLYWDHLQARINEAVAAEGTPSRFAWLPRLPQARVLLPSAAAVLVALAVAMQFDSRVTMPQAPSRPVLVPLASQPRNTAELPASSRVELLNDLLADSDPSLELVADLTSTLDWNAARDAGLAARGSAEHAVTHLSARELLELQKLLQQEMEKTGA